MHKYSNYLLISLFFLAIATPSVVMLLQHDAAISDNEKRRLTALPKLHWDKRLLTEFPVQFTEYFNDHYGLRSKIISLNQRLKYRYFDKSPLRQVIVGEKGWLFFDFKESLSDHIGMIPLSETILDGWQQHLLDKQQWLAEIGIKYLFVPIPNKMTMYQEYLPRRIREYSGPTMLDQLLEYLQTNNKFTSYLDLKQALLTTKQKSEQLYFRTDTHWTSLGAFYSYQFIVKQLQQMLPVLDNPMQLADLEKKARDKRGDLSRMIAVSEQLTEPTFMLQPIQQCSSNEYIEMVDFKKTKSYALRKKKLPVLNVNGCASKKTTAVVVHDSFGYYLRPFLSETFSRVIYMHSYDLKGMKSFLQKEKPDVYIDLRVERNVKYLLAPLN